MSAPVLIVDDESAWARNVARFLQMRGVEAVVAETLAEARQAFDRHGAAALCLDRRLPDGDGLAFLDRLRSGGARTPCLLVTSYADGPARQEASRLDAGVVEKPCSLEHLATLVTGIVGEASRKASPGGSGGRRLRVATYSHDGFGLGHMRRSLNIAGALVRASSTADVLMLVGCPNGLFFDLPERIDFVKLPSIVKVASEDWKPRKLALEPERARALRSGLLEQTLALFEPDVLLVDHLPDGVHGELLPALRRLRRSRPEARIVLGLRDVLDRPERIRAAWRKNGRADVIRELYDLVLVYGQREIHDSVAAYDLPADRTRFCGYVANGEAAVPDAGGGGGRSARRIVVTGGGGADAGRLCLAAVEALRLLGPPDAVEMLVVLGPLMPEAERQRVIGAARGLPVAFLPWLDDCREVFAGADLVVGMAGYNSLVELVALGHRPVVVPRPGPSGEQRIRARLFGELGLVDPIPPEDLAPDRLACAMARALREKRAPARCLDLDGADRAASILLESASQAAAPHHSIRETIG